MPWTSSLDQCATCQLVFCLRLIFIVIRVVCWSFILSWAKTRVVCCQVNTMVRTQSGSVTLMPIACTQQHWILIKLYCHISYFLYSNEARPVTRYLKFQETIHVLLLRKTFPSKAQTTKSLVHVIVRKLLNKAMNPSHRSHHIVTSNQRVL